MTITEPQTFGGRQAALERSASQPPASLATRDLSEQFKIAASVAAAGEAVPPGYRNKPGAVILAIGWAVQHDVDLLTAIQNISFIGGKSVVEATMQRALAKRAGITIKIPEANLQLATVELHRDGQLIGSATYTIEQAETAKLTAKDNWRKNTEDMLVARATTRVIRRFAPDVLLGMLTAEEVEDGTDDLLALTADDEPTTVETAPANVIEAEVVEDLTARLDRAGVNQGAYLRKAREVAQAEDLEPPTTFDEAAADTCPAVIANALDTWLDQLIEVRKS